MASCSLDNQLSNFLEALSVGIAGGAGIAALIPVSKRLRIPPVGRPRSDHKSKGERRAEKMLGK